MTTSSPATIECVCGHAYSAELMDGVHVSSHPELRRAVLNGSLHQLTCPRCGREVQVEKLIAYTDFDRDQWFAVAPRAGLTDHVGWRERVIASFEATMIEGAPPLVRDEWVDQMNRRLVFGLAALREKLVIHELALDDRVVEAMKLHMTTDGGVAFSLDTYLHLRGAEDDTLLFDYRPPGMLGFETLTVSRSHHDRVAADLGTLRVTHGFLFDDWIVDQRLWHLPDRAGLVE